MAAVKGNISPSTGVIGDPEEFSDKKELLDK
jgi:hypothetical protein